MSILDYNYWLDNICNIHQYSKKDKYNSLDIALDSSSMEIASNLILKGAKIHKFDYGYLTSTNLKRLETLLKDYETINIKEKYRIQKTLNIISYQNKDKDMILSSL